MPGFMDQILLKINQLIAQIFVRLLAPPPLFTKLLQYFLLHEKLFETRKFMTDQLTVQYRM